MSTRKETLNGLKPLFERAEKEGLWFYSPYQSLIFSPSELRKRHKKGEFIWGVMNWELVDPRRELAGKKVRLESVINYEEGQYLSLKMRMEKEGITDA